MLVKPQTQKIKSKTSTAWFIDAAHSTVEFTVRYLILFTVQGRFEDISGTLQLDDDLARASVEVAIAAKSISTTNKHRDAHLRSPDFLAVERYPEILFESSSVQRGCDRDTLEVGGLLTIRGTSRQISLNVNELDQSRSPNGEEVIYYNCTTDLDRFNFGVNYLPGLISRKVSVVLNIQATRAAID